MAKVQISISDELLARIDEMAKTLYTNRSAYISMVMAQTLNAQEKMYGIAGKALENLNDKKDESSTKK